MSDRDGTHLDGAGDCFEVAGQLIMDLEAGPRLTYTLVHGIPRGTDGDTLGLRYWHAWVECTRTVDFPQVGPIEIIEVIDLSNGNDLCLPQAVYYKLGNIEQTWRYTQLEAAQMMTQHQHYGPWVQAEVDLHAGQD